MFRKPIIFALILFILASQNSCVSIITPPADPENPCSVYLLTEARHRGIVLPDLEGGYVEYGFGDWDWYALIYNKWYHVFDTVLWPTQGCLGRRRLSSVELDRILGSGRLHAVTVGRGEARALLKELDRRFRRNSTTQIYNGQYGRYFVQDDRGFWFLYNCHDAVAEWMAKLGCEVSWVPIRHGLKIREP